ncbi:MAG: hypothetical protein HQK96_14020 [Nitrospirae bacterium]|nr:hypothetical protein [Nitrospirota bacterium]
MGAIMEALQKAVQSILAIGIVVAVFVLFYAILFRGVAGTEKDIILFVLGSATSIVTQIVSFYFGSSKDSHDKTKTIDALSAPTPQKLEENNEAGKPQ